MFCWIIYPLKPFLQSISICHQVTEFFLTRIKIRTTKGVCVALWCHRKVDFKLGFFPPNMGLYVILRETVLCSARESLELLIWSDIDLYSSKLFSSNQFACFCCMCSSMNLPWPWLFVSEILNIVILVLSAGNIYYWNVNLYLGLDCVGWAIGVLWCCKHERT